MLGLALVTPASDRLAEGTFVVRPFRTLSPHGRYQARQPDVLIPGEQGDLAAWLEPARRRLVGDGYAGVCEVVAQPIAGAAAQRRGAEVSGGVLNYFAGQQQRLGYAARLRRGQVIGSGLVEGTIKELVNLRMKRAGARWLPGHVGPFVELLALTRGPEWQEHWSGLAV